MRMNLTNLRILPCAMLSLMLLGACSSPKPTAVLVKPDRALTEPLDVPVPAGDTEADTGRFYLDLVGLTGRLMRDRAVLDCTYHADVAEGCGDEKP